MSLLLLSLEPDIHDDSIWRAMSLKFIGFGDDDHVIGRSWPESFRVPVTCTGLWADSYTVAHYMMSICMTVQCQFGSSPFDLLKYNCGSFTLNKMVPTPSPAININVNITGSGSSNDGPKAGGGASSEPVPKAPAGAYPRSLPKTNGPKFVPGAHSEFDSDERTGTNMTSAEVQRAAAELKQETGGPKLRPAPSVTVTGPLPPCASSTGKKYYCFERLRPPCIACGQDVALALLGGSWTINTYGRSPVGYDNLETAVNHMSKGSTNSVLIRWKEIQ